MSLLSPRDFIIEKFEHNHQDIVELIHKWQQLSIEQDWPELRVGISVHNYKKCPADVWGEKEQMNLRYKFFRELSEKITSYLIAKGYKKTSWSYPETCLAPGGVYMNGFIIRAYVELNENDNIKITQLKKVLENKN